MSLVPVSEPVPGAAAELGPSSPEAE